MVFLSGWNIPSSTFFKTDMAYQYCDNYLVIPLIAMGQFLMSTGMLLNGWWGLHLCNYLFAWQ